MPDGIRIEDFQSAFDGGINSNVVPTVASQKNPNGLKRNQSAWITNGTVRGGGVMPRTGWNRLVRLAAPGAKWQFGYMYEPDFNFPYLIHQIDGRIYQCRVDTDNSIVDLSAAFGLTNPPTTDRAFFCLPAPPLPPVS